ncbi:MAG: hypothetical protein RL596_484 [Bacteroidota bacterium]|jgi:hypothetical protein
MKKSSFKILLPSLFIASTCFSQITIENRRPTNNPSVNGPVVDAREVGDPTLAAGKNGSVNRVQADNNAKLLQQMANSGLSFTGYQVEVINPLIHLLPPTPLQIGKIKIIDVRADPYKIGFKPVEYAQRRKGVNAIAIQLKEGVNKWLLNDVLGNFLQTDSNSNRQLVVVVNQCWLSNEANYPYHASNPKLFHELHYNLTIYSHLGSGYFPQKKMAGTFSSAYIGDEKVSPLFDSLAQLICKEVSTIDFTVKENEDHLITSADFNSYYNEQKNRLNNVLLPLQGVYKTYEDFLAQRVDSDSTEMIIKYDNAGRFSTYACQLMQFNNQDPESTTKSWGYSDGKALYVNIGNGFFVRLVRSGGNYIFYWLNNMREDRIKASVSNGIKLGNSSFEIIKDYSRVTPLTYQLDALTGKLY